MSGKLLEIQQSVGQVSDIVDKTATAAKEQSAGANAITNTIADINRVTEQNVATSQQSSAAAARLSSGAEELTSMVRSFRIDAKAGDPSLVWGGMTSRQAADRSSQHPQ